MLQAGVYPASVTPFLPGESVDEVSFVRLLAHFEASGCAGVVVGGTNGEGPSLSAIERRDLLRLAVKGAGKLLVIQGIATSSLSEAQWLCQQALKDGAAAALVMPPMYFRPAPETGVRDWFLRLMDSSALPILAYNFPKNTGFTISPKLLAQLAGHPNLLGVKDSSGEVANIPGYRAVLGDQHRLFVGNETLLDQALEHGWTGTISGAANTIPQWLAQVVSEFTTGKAHWRTKFALIQPVLEHIRTLSQPAHHKAVLTAKGVIAHATVRLPLQPADSFDGLRALLSEKLGEF